MNNIKCIRTFGVSSVFREIIIRFCMVFFVKSPENLDWFRLDIHSYMNGRVYVFIF